MSYLTHIENYLTNAGFSAEQALGITAGISAESKGDPNAVGPVTNVTPVGALGIGQWLGSRRTAIQSLYGSNPTLDQQLSFLVSELRGTAPDGSQGGSHVTSQTTAIGAMTAYIKDFMRPAAGSQTTGDISRGTDFIKKKGSNVASPTSYASSVGAPVQTWNTAGDYINNIGQDLGLGTALGQASNATGSVLAAPGNALDSAAAKLYGGLSLGSWFGRVSFGILAFILIAVALVILSGKGQQVVANIPPIAA